jgi:hypothetical protein
MRVLFLVQRDQRIILDRLYDAIIDAAAATGGSCDLRRLADEEQADLRGYFRAHVDLARYDRIMMMVRFKKAIRQRRFLRTLPNLVILEHDAYQNYIASKYRGEYSKHYRALPWVRVFCSGYTVTQRLRDEGVDVHFVAKGYDQSLLRNLERPRRTELAFVGSTGNKLYVQRKQFLDELTRVEPLQIVRTKSGEEYLDKLNDIRFFVSADIGMGEYMIKNFEAMACGCVLFAWDQGADENAALGLVDMRNIVLYRSQNELREKLQLLRGDTARADAIAAAGQHLVEQHLTWARIGSEVVNLLVPPLREYRPPKTLLQKIFG